MRILVAILLLGSIAPLRADDIVAQAQQVLKDRGFYFGQVTGQKDADTSDALRRYQIRNGLQVTGDLNEETAKSLRNPPPMTNTAKAAPTAMPAPSSAPDDTSDLRADPAQTPIPRNNPVPPQPYAITSPNQPGGPPMQGSVVPSQDALFAGTPYEKAAPEVQRKVLTDAKKVLGRRGFYRGAIDGYYGDEMEFSVRAFQSSLHLPVTGRLDTETLGNLGLLPGARPPGWVAPRRRPLPPGLEEPPVRGEWVRP